MSTLSNLISKLSSPHPEIVDLFTDEYRKRLIKNISDQILNEVKVLVNKYIEEELEGDIINYKVYSYKTLEGISAEILIQPENTSVIVQYILNLTESDTEFKRLR